MNHPRELYHFEHVALLKSRWHSSNFCAVPSSPRDDRVVWVIAHLIELTVWAESWVSSHVAAGMPSEGRWSLSGSGLQPLNSSGGSQIVLCASLLHFQHVCLLHSSCFWHIAIKTYHELCGITWSVYWNMWFNVKDLVLTCPILSHQLTVPCHPFESAWRNCSFLFVLDSLSEPVLLALWKFYGEPIKLQLVTSLWYSPSVGLSVANVIGIRCSEGARVSVVFTVTFQLWLLYVVCVLSHVSVVFTVMFIITCWEMFTLVLIVRLSVVYFHVNCHVSWVFTVMCLVSH